MWLCVAFDGLSITSIGGLYHFLGFVDIARVTAGVDYERHSLHSIVQLSRNDRCTCAVLCVQMAFANYGHNGVAEQRTPGGGLYYYKC